MTNVKNNGKLHSFFPGTFLLQEDEKIIPKLSYMYNSKVDQTAAQNTDQPCVKKHT